jgi:hypothetical protein
MLWRDHGIKHDGIAGAKSNRVSSRAPNLYIQHNTYMVVYIYIYNLYVYIHINIYVCILSLMLLFFFLLFLNNKMLEYALTDYTVQLILHTHCTSTLAAV